MHVRTCSPRSWRDPGSAGAPGGSAPGAGTGAGAATQVGGSEGQQGPSHSAAPGPNGTTSVPSSFSRTRQRGDTDSSTTPASHPTTGISGPDVSSRTAASSRPVPAGRCTGAGEDAGQVLPCPTRAGRSATGRCAAGPTAPRHGGRGTRPATPGFRRTFSVHRQCTQVWAGGPHGSAALAGLVHNPAGCCPQRQATASPPTPHTGPQEPPCDAPYGLGPVGVRR